MNLAFPYAFDATGRTAQSDPLRLIGDLIEQILFTSPGERVNRPTFGSGTAQLVFAPNSDVLAAAQQQAIQAGLQQWLSDLIRANSVTVAADDDQPPGHGDHVNGVVAVSTVRPSRSRIGLLSGDASTCR